MDMVKMGSFLAELRKEQKLTQAELGEKLGVTNKTVSRWETGIYMPPVEILEELSRLYGLTINEILSGRKLTTEEYKEMAESNIRETLKASTFELKEKQEFENCFYSVGIFRFRFGCLKREFYEFYISLLA